MNIFEKLIFLKNALSSSSVRIKNAATIDESVKKYIKDFVSNTKIIDKLANTKEKRAKFWDIVDEFVPHTLTQDEIDYLVLIKGNPNDTNASASRNDELIGKIGARILTFYYDLMRNIRGSVKTAGRSYEEWCEYLRDKVNKGELSKKKYDQFRKIWKSVMEQNKDLPISKQEELAARSAIDILPESVLETVTPYHGKGKSQKPLTKKSTSEAEDFKVNPVPPVAPGLGIGLGLGRRRNMDPNCPYYDEREKLRQELLGKYGKGFLELLKQKMETITKQIEKEKQKEE